MNYPGYTASKNTNETSTTYPNPGFKSVKVKCYQARLQFNMEATEEIFWWVNK